ncbi:MAG TPA: hypothetical protein VFB34_12080 [Chloroflexota bacterium]|nr:hypothetical protein [Chloroflexota bacterium]
MPAALLVLILASGAVYAWIGSPGRAPAVTHVFQGGGGWSFTQAEIGPRQPFFFSVNLVETGERLRFNRVTVQGMRFAGRLPQHVRQVGEIDIPGIGTSSGTARDLAGFRTWPHYRRAWPFVGLRGYSEAGIGDLGSAGIVLAASRRGLYHFVDPTIWGTIRTAHGEVRPWRVAFGYHYYACVGFSDSRCQGMFNRALGMSH